MFHHSRTIPPIALKKEERKKKINKYKEAS
jgi:hypothetical protein